MQMMYKVYERMVTELLLCDNLQVMLMASLIGTEHHGSKDLYLPNRSSVWLVGIHNKLLEGNGFRTVETDFSWLWNRLRDIIAPLLRKYGGNLEKDFERDVVRLNISI